MATVRTWIRCAAHEWAVARLFETGDDVVLDVVVDPPKWFIDYELGFKLGHGPTIIYTTEHLDEINRAHRAELRLAEAPKRRQRASAVKRQHEWQEMLRRIALDRARERRERRRARAARLAA